MVIIRYFYLLLILINNNFIDYVEATQVKLENTMLIDGNIIISNKLIQLNPSVRITFGPLVGLVTQTSIRLLIQISKSSNLSFHIFSVNNLSLEGVFIESQVFNFYFIILFYFFVYFHLCFK